MPDSLQAKRPEFMPSRTNAAFRRRVQVTLLSMASTVLSSVPPTVGPMCPNAITPGCRALWVDALTAVLSVAMTPTWHRHHEFANIECLAKAFVQHGMARCERSRS